MKDWIKNMLTFIVAWSILNSAYVFFVLTIKESYFGQTEFLRAFAISTTVELSFSVAIGVIIYMIYRLVKKIIKVVR